MDIKCINCGEPWDTETIHEEIAERWEDTGDNEDYQRYYAIVADDFYKRGCPAFYGSKCNTDNLGDKNGEILSELYGAFGEDVDAMACMIEDFDL